MQNNPITSDVVKHIKGLEKRLSVMENRPTGTIVVDKQIITTDPSTGVKTVIGNLASEGEERHGIMQWVGDVEPPPVPSTPIVTSQMGLFTLIWDGANENLLPHAPDFSHIKLYGTQGTSTFDVGIIKTGQESAIYSETQSGEVWTFWATSVDFNGNESAASVITDPIAVVSSVEDPDIAGALQKFKEDIATAESIAASADAMAGSAWANSAAVTAQVAAATAQSASAWTVASQASAIAVSATARAASADAMAVTADAKAVSAMAIASAASADAITASAIAASADVNAANAWAASKTATAAAQTATAQSASAWTVASAASAVAVSATAAAASADAKAVTASTQAASALSVARSATAAAASATAQASSAQTQAQTAYDQALAATQTATGAVSVANGKNTVWFTTPPASGNTVGDTYYKESEQNRMYQWDGSAWIATTYGASALSANSITAAHITASAITAGKLAANSVVAANITSGSINATHIASQAITASAIKAQSITATAIAANSITATAIAAQSITATALAAQSISATALAADSITTTALKAGQIAASHIVANAITTSHIKSLSIAASHIVSNAITADELAASSVTASHIRAGVVDATHIKSQTITATALASQSITASAIRSQSITATALAAGSITASAIASQTITATALAADSITTTALKAGQIAASHIVANAITTSHIKSLSIAASHIVSNAITADELAASSVTASHIRAKVINATHLQADSITATAIRADQIAASHIVADAITASHIKSGTILAKSLAITNFDNLLPNLTTQADDWIIDGAIQNSASSPDGKEFTLRSGAASQAIPATPVGVIPGEKIRIEYVATNGGATVTRELCWFGNGASGILNTEGGAAGSRVSVIWTVPASIIQVRFAVRAKSTNTYWTVFHSFTARKMTGGSLIVEGEILADHIAASAIETQHIKTNAITTDKIDSGAVTAGTIAASAITAGKIAANAVVAANIAASAIVAGKIAANAVSAANIVSNAITADELAASSIAASHIRAGVIDASHIKADSITTDKMVIGTGSNIIPNSQLTSIAGWAGWGRNATNGPSGQPSIWALGSSSKYSDSFPIEGGVLYRFSVSILATYASTRTYIRLVAGGAETPMGIENVSTGTTWSTFSGEVLVPAGATTAQIRVYPNHSNSVNTTGYQWYTNWSLTAMVDGSLIVNGAIDGKTITGGTIIGGSITGATITMDAKSFKVIMGTDSAGGLLSFTTPDSTTPATVRATREVYGTDQLPGLILRSPATSSYNKRAYIKVLSGSTSIGYEPLIEVGGMIDITGTYNGLGLPASSYVSGKSDLEVSALTSLSLYGNYATANESELVLNKDGNGGYFLSTAVFNRTYTSASNMYVTVNGVLGRSTSSRKNKLCIEETPPETYEDKLLGLRAVSWFDKGESEQVSEYYRRVSEDDWPVDDKGVEEVLDAPDALRRIPGMIAEEVLEAGLPEFIHYGNNGEVEGLMYERLGVALIPVVGRLRDRVVELERKIDLLLAQYPVVE